MSSKASVNCEIDSKNKKFSLYRDDFENQDSWESICNMFDVPKWADQIYFNAEDITYG